MACILNNSDVHEADRPEKRLECFRWGSYLSGTPDLRRSHNQHIASRSKHVARHTVTAVSVATAHNVEFHCTIGFMTFPMRWIIPAARRIDHVCHVEAAFLSNMRCYPCQKSQKYSRCKPWLDSCRKVDNLNLRNERLLG